MVVVVYMYWRRSTQLLSEVSLAISMVLHVLGLLLCLYPKLNINLPRIAVTLITIPCTLLCLSILATQGFLSSLELRKHFNVL